MLCPLGGKGSANNRGFLIMDVSFVPSNVRVGHQMLVTSITSYLRTCTLPTMIYGYSYDLFRFCTIYILIIMMHIKVDIHLIQYYRRSSKDLENIFFKLCVVCFRMLTERQRFTLRAVFRQARNGWRPTSYLSQLQQWEWQSYRSERLIHI